MTTADTSSTLSDEFHNIIQDVESLLQEAASLSGEEYADIRSQLLTRVTAAKAEMTRVGNNLAEVLQDSTAELSAEFHREPWKAAAAAGVAGFLMGYLFARK